MKDYKIEIDVKGMDLIVGYLEKLKEEKEYYEKIVEKYLPIFKINKQ